MNLANIIIRKELYMKNDITDWLDIGDEDSEIIQLTEGLFENL